MGLYFGITALIDQYDAASGCGWWLWGTTFAGVAYGPVGMLLSLMSIAYTAMIVHDIKDAPGAAVLASGMCSVCLLVCTFSVSAVLIGTLAEGLWNEYGLKLISSDRKQICLNSVLCTWRLSDPFNSLT